MALAFCYTKWQVASTIIGVTSRGAARRGPRCLGHDAVRRSAGRDRQDPLGNARPGAIGSGSRWQEDHVSETPATAVAAGERVAFTEHPYEYLEHGGAQHSAPVLGLDPFTRGQDAGDAGRGGQAADRADARQPQGVDQEPGAPDRRQVGRALQARGGATGTAATWSAAPRRSARARRCRSTSRRRSSSCRNRHQRRAARLPGGHRPAGAARSCWAPSRCNARCRARAQSARAVAVLSVCARRRPARAPAP